MRRPRWTRALSASFALLFALLAAEPARVGTVARAAAPATLHAGLVSAEPAKNATLAAAPQRLRLVFSEPVVASLSEIRLVGPQGAARRLDVTGDPRDVHALVAPLPPSPPLADGTYRVRWRIVSADGHPVEGSYVFRIAGAAPDSAGAPDTVRPSALPGINASPAAGDSIGGARVDADDRAAGGALAEVPALAAFLRGAGVGCLMALLGLLIFDRAAPRGTERRTRRLDTTLGAGAAILLIAHLVAWLAHTAPAGGMSVEWAAAAVATPVGAVEAARAGLALLALGALALARRPVPAAIFAAGALLASAAAGHAVAVEPLWNVPAKALHLLAGSLWLGGLLWLLAHEPDWATFPAAAALVSSLALWAVILVAVSGVAQTVLLLPAPRDLVRTPYGALVLAKVAGLVTLVLFGAHHRFRVLPRLRAAGTGPAAPADLRRTVRLEVAVMAAVLLAAGVLAYIPTPPPAP